MILNDMWTTPFFDPSQKDRIIALNRFHNWKLKLTDKSIAASFDKSSWTLWKSYWTCKSSCGTYRLVIMDKKVRLYINS